MNDYTQSSVTYMILNFYFSPLSQEEEIPELEIDIDELLELSDEGQRTRLEVPVSVHICIWFDPFLDYRVATFAEKNANVRVSLLLFVVFFRSCCKNAGSQRR